MQLLPFGIVDKAAYTQGDFSKMKKQIADLTKAISEPTNGAKALIETSVPYTINLKIEGTADLLLHRWNCEYVDAKSKLKKGSDGKKRDDIEQFVYRNEEGEICLPGEYLRQSIINAAKYKQDPRSPRKSAMDLFKAGIIINEKLCSLGIYKWDYVDTRRVVIQRSGINRSRPAMNVGWHIECTLTILLPEYIDNILLHECIQQAGRFVGVGDFRPTFGRFQIVKYEIEK